jgi:hypothetical protein
MLDGLSTTSKVNAKKKIVCHAAKIDRFREQIEGGIKRKKYAEKKTSVRR